MKTGTKSVLFGVHAFWYHPITVWLAWRKLYGRWPGFWESIAIFVHDLGYFGKAKMDSTEGEWHPIVGARLLHKLYMHTHRGNDAQERAEELFWFVLLHSRYLSARLCKQPSDLCWADKLSMSFDPAWWYLFRARLSGEIAEYREQAREKISLAWPDERWFKWCREKCAKDAREKRVAFPRKHDKVGL